MAGVTLRKLVKRFSKDVTAVDQLDLEIRDGEFMVLVGPSGCGKTTALRMIAGLEEATSGEILIGERVVNDVSPKDRDIAMVFQNYALFPHMTVYDNMAFGLRLKRKPASRPWPFNTVKAFDKTEIDRRVRETAGQLGLENLLTRKPKELSGGQRQRVALGRAIVREPKVFLMDEPLSNLDAKLRVHTRAELIKLHRRLGITTVYVTHDQVEAMTMGDRIAVMNGGVLQQCDTPLNLYNRPANMFVAGFIGSPAMNFLPVRLDAEGPQLFAVADGLKLQLPPQQAEAAHRYVGRECIFGIRPEHILDRSLPGTLSPSTGNTVVAGVDVLEPLGHNVGLYITLGGQTLTALVDSRTKAQVGQPLEMVMDLENCHLFDKDTQTAIT
jgi:multiple sugar transport system ATP-binding protein